MTVRKRRVNPTHTVTHECHGIPGVEEFSVQHMVPDQVEYIIDVTSMENYEIGQRGGMKARGLDMGIDVSGRLEYKVDIGGEYAKDTLDGKEKRVVNDLDVTAIEFRPQTGSHRDIVPHSEFIMGMFMDTYRPWSLWDR